MLSTKNVLYVERLLKELVEFQLNYIAFKGL